MSLRLFYRSETYVTVPIEDYRSYDIGLCVLDCVQVVEHSENYFQAAKMPVKRASMSMNIPLKMIQWICIWFCYKKGLTPTETFKDLKDVFWWFHMKKRTVFFWHKEYRDGHLRPGDKPRSGHPRVRKPALIANCKTLIHADQRIGIHQLSVSLQVSYGTVYTMIHKDLGLTKHAAKFIPHVLTDVQRENRMDFAMEFLDHFGEENLCHLDWIVTCDEAWFHLLEPNTKIQNMQWLEKDQPRPQQAKCSKSNAKVMLIPFFDSRGIVYWEYFENQTITKEVFLPLLARVRHAIRVRRGHQIFNKGYRYLLHMDNALSHNSDLVQGGLRDFHWSVLEHPPYSPDLSPCDFFLFPLKKRLRGRKFNNTQLLKQEIDLLLGQISTHQWKACFEDWIVRCKKCLVADGRYFEGLHLKV